MIEYKVKVYENKIEWYLNGKLHREDGPAVEWKDGNKIWYISGKFHREDGPAIEYVNGIRYWYLNGQNLTEEEFNKRINSSSCNGKVVEIDGKKIRVERVMIEYTVKVYDNRTEWHLDGKLHREDGPAVRAYGSKFWYINGKRHREDGPAIEYINGNKEWYINGQKLTEEEFNKRMNSSLCNGKIVEIDGKKYELKEL